MASGRGLDPEIPDPPGGIRPDSDETTWSEDAPEHMKKGNEEPDSNGDDQAPSGG